MSASLEKYGKDKFIPFFCHAIKNEFMMGK
jgi:hypothetical protein